MTLVEHASLPGSMTRSVYVLHSLDAERTEERLHTILISIVLDATEILARCLIILSMHFSQRGTHPRFLSYRCRDISPHKRPQPRYGFDFGSAMSHDRIRIQLNLPNLLK